MTAREPIISTAVAVTAFFIALTDTGRQQAGIFVVCFVVSLFFATIGFLALDKTLRQAYGDLLAFWVSVALGFLLGNLFYHYMVNPS